MVASGLLLALRIAAGASPTPSPPPSASPAPSAEAELRFGTVVCRDAPLYTWPSGASRPATAAVPAAHLGERFRIVAGPRYTLGSRGFYETTIPVLTGFATAGEHYWLSEECLAVTTER